MESLSRKTPTQYASSNICTCKHFRSHSPSSSHASHKRLTFAFTGKIEYSLAFSQRIAHNGPQAETGGSPPSSTVQFCAASEIALIAAFVTLDLVTLLYTYISRLSVVPHHHQKRKSRQNYRHNSVPSRFLSCYKPAKKSSPN